jgi:hypothetical protein
LRHGCASIWEINRKKFQSELRHGCASNREINKKISKAQSCFIEHFLQDKNMKVSAAYMRIKKGNQPRIFNAQNYGTAALKTCAYDHHDQ